MSEWIIRLIDQTGYLGVGFLMFLETVFPPIPSEVIMPEGRVSRHQSTRLRQRVALNPTTPKIVTGKAPCSIPKPFSSVPAARDRD